MPFQIDWSNFRHRETERLYWPCWYCYCHYSHRPNIMPILYNGKMFFQLLANKLNWIEYISYLPSIWKRDGLKECYRWESIIIVSGKWWARQICRPGKGTSNGEGERESKIKSRSAKVVLRGARLLYVLHRDTHTIYNECDWNGKFHCAVA